jgi:hypothetical protein
LNFDYVDFDHNIEPKRERPDGMATETAHEGAPREGILDIGHRVNQQRIRREEEYMMR